jgi:hypothetical protein
LRMDSDEGFQIDQIEFITGQHAVPLLNDPAVQVAKKRILEIRVPNGLLGIPNGDPIRFRLAIANQTVPAEGWFDIASPA